MITVNLNEDTRTELLQLLKGRNPASYKEQQAAVDDIIAKVVDGGDRAIIELEEKFDHCRLMPETLRVTREEIEAAYEELDPAFIDVMKRAANNIRAYHEEQKKKIGQNWQVLQPDGSILGQRVTPIQVSGCYVPGGRAVYPSSVLMNIIPAKVAGVEKIIMCTPPDRNGRVPAGSVVAADIAGADEIYKVGGAQAIAAMAYGTETIPRVDKITGPGNIYVALAKKAVFGITGIDSVAGPSEILVLADESANPRFVAADLLSQAEHDPLASSILLTTSKELADKVSEEIDGFLQTLSRADIMRQSLDNYGRIFVSDNMDELIDAANEIASEHMEIVTKDPWKTMEKVKNAGAIFLGPWSSEPLGDYYAGPNHILPTNSTARFSSPLGVDQFIKRSSVICYTRDALQRDSKDIELFAENEQLTAHANSIAVRFEEN